MNIKLSPYQILLMYLGSIIVTGHLLFVPILSSKAKQDGWISLIIATLILLLQFLVMVSLASKYPGKNIIEFSEEILGKWLGKIVGLIFCIYEIAAIITIIHMEGEVINLTIMPETPSYVISLPILLLGYWVASAGIEVIARCTQLILPILVILGLTSTMALAPDRSINNILPVMDNPFNQTLAAGFSLAGFFSTSILFLALVKYTNDINKSRLYGLISVLVIFISFIGPVTGPVTIFGPGIAKNLILPTYTELTYVNITNFFERFNAIGIVLWTGGSFIKISVMFYIITDSIRFLIGRENWGKQISLVLFIFLLFTLKLKFSIFQFQEFWKTNLWYVIFSVGMGIPLMLWMILKVKSIFIRE